MQTQRCVIAYPDAGRRCTDGDQCAGDCVLPEDGKRGQGAGVCQANDDPCGCRTRIENGRETATLCVD